MRMPTSDHRRLRATGSALAPLLAGLAASILLASCELPSVSPAGSSAKAITEYSLAYEGGSAVGVITATAIAVTLPYGKAVSGLVATFTTTGETVKVGSTVQSSGTTANDFGDPVDYTVYAADGTSQDYTVTVTVASSDAKELTAFSIGAAAGSLDGTAITVGLPYGTDLSSLSASFSTTGTSVTVGGTVQESGATANSFSSALTYTVHAADGTTQDYTVTVVFGPHFTADLASSALEARNADLVLTVAAEDSSGDGTSLSYQWMATAAGGSTFSAVSGATSASYAFSAATAGTYLVKAVATDSLGLSVSSTECAITVLAPTLVLPDTGQTGSYTAIAGEDSERTVNAPSYTDNGNGTVTDEVTGLMWEQYDGGEMTYDDAVTYCAGLAKGGYSDWRLPTARELYSINDLGALGPALDDSAFSEDYVGIYGSEYLKELYWWSSDQRADTDTRRWVTNAGGGLGAHMESETYSAGVASQDGKIRYFHVRAVRSDSIPDLSATRFVENGNGTVTDLWTGLVWQDTPSSTTYTWEGALAAVNSLNASGGYAGRSDWRLPNIRELQSLVDVTRMSPCIDPAYFHLSALSPYAEPSTPEEPGALWSSTSMYNADTSKSSQAWDLHDLYSGIISYSDKTAVERILLVRGGD